VRPPGLALPVIAVVAFVSLGLPDGVLGVAWPSVRRDFGVPVSHLGVLVGASMLGYLASTSSTGPLVARLGVGRLLLCSCAAVAAACLGLALSPAWWVVVACGILAGLGAGAVDAGVNAFAAQRFAPRMVSWLHASYGVGAMLGPLLMTAAIIHGPGWRVGYAAVGLALGAMAACFAATRGLWQVRGHAGREEASVSARATLTRPAVWGNVAVFFVYTGLEVSSGQWAYSLLTEARAIDPAAAGVAVGVFWGSLTAGRVACGLLARRVPAPAILRVAVVAAPVAAAVLWRGQGTAAAFVGLAALGAALAPVFPLMISLTPRRVGEAYTTHAIGFQVAAAYLGAAALPAAAGALAGRYGVAVIGPFLAGVAVALLALHTVALRHPAAGDARPAYLSARRREVT
jgi:fucose permease